MPNSTDNQNTPSPWSGPNSLTAFRLVGSIALIPLAVLGMSHLFAATYAILVFTDLIDGWLARRFHVESELGARLDTYADLGLNSCLLFGILVLCWETLRRELWLIGPAVLSYALAVLASFLKFGRLPAYHTYLAKVAQALTPIAAICLIIDYSVWPLRVVTVVVLIANLESTGISWLLPEWRSDIRSIFKVSRGGKP